MNKRNASGHAKSLRVMMLLRAAGEGPIDVDDAATLLGVTQRSARREIAALASEGLLDVTRSSPTSMTTVVGRYHVVPVEVA